MYATKRRLEVQHRRGQLAARTDLPRSTFGKRVFGARKARLAILAAEAKATTEPEVADPSRLVETISGEPSATQ